MVTIRKREREAHKQRSGWRKNAGRKGPMGEHCIGSPFATKAVSHGLSALSRYIGKENGIFDQNSLEKRRVMFKEELVALKRNDCSLELTEREMEILNLLWDSRKSGISG